MTHGATHLVSDFAEPWVTGTSPVMTVGGRESAGMTKLSQWANAYLGTADPDLFVAISKDLFQGITLTCPGFYGPQGRKLRIETLYSNKTFDSLSKLTYHGFRFTNFEMETAGIYGLAYALGHQAVSANIILGNRVTGEFSKNSGKAVEQGIGFLMERISDIMVKEI